MSEAIGTTTNRPWGSYTILDDSPNHKVKRIVVNYGGRLSYQLHRRRNEHWFVVSGRGMAIINDEIRGLGPGMSQDIPIGTLHRVECISREPLVFIEVQTGDYFGEDDIERVEDDYGRARA